MAKDFLSIRCPDDILAAIEERMKATGRSRTDVVVKLLRQALGLSLSESEMSDGLTLDERVESILEDKMHSFVNSINQKFLEQEKRIEALEKHKA